MKHLKGRYGRLICLVFLVLDLLLILFVAGILLHENFGEKSKREKLAKRIGVTEEMDEQIVEEQFAIAVGEALARISMYSEVTVRDQSVGIFLSNESEYAVKASVVLTQTGDVIAETGLIDPGYRLEQLELNVVPESGQYHCLVRLGFYTVDDGTYLGTAAKQMLLNVE